MKDKDYLKLFLISVIIFFIVIVYFAKTPKKPKKYILPDWGKPVAMCNDDYFDWNIKDTCKNNWGVRYWLLDD